MSIEEPHPSLARQGSIIAMALLATVIPVAGYYIVFFVLDYGWIAVLSDFWSLVQDHREEFPLVLGTFCFGTLASSPLLLRLARVSMLWHSASLATLSVVASFGLLKFERLNFIDNIIAALIPPRTADSHFLGRVMLITFAMVANIAVGSLLYRLSRRYFHRNALTTGTTPEPAPFESPRFGTRAEFRTLVLLLISILLCVGGIALL
jgi:hypothetical protein